MNIVFKVTAAESPFNNSLLKRHNFTIDDKLVLSSYLNALKQSLATIHGFSPACTRAELKTAIHIK